MFRGWVGSNLKTSLRGVWLFFRTKDFGLVKLKPAHLPLCYSHLINQDLCTCTLLRYVVSYAESNYSEPQRLTQAGYSHAVSLNEVKSETRWFNSGVLSVRLSSIPRALENNLRINLRVQ